MTPRDASLPETDFAAWRRQMEFTYDQAAEALHVSISHVKNWEFGKNRSRGNKAEPSHAVRILMTAIADGLDLEPWPCKKKRKAKG